MTAHEISLTGGQASMEHEERTVLKFRLAVGETTIPLPESAIPLHVDVIDGDIFVWIELPTSSDHTCETDRTFHVYGTGWPQRTDRCHAHVGTVVNEVAWHVYETHMHTPEEINAMKAINSLIGEWEMGV